MLAVRYCQLLPLHGMRHQIIILLWKDFSILNNETYEYLYARFGRRPRIRTATKTFGESRATVTPVAYYLVGLVGFEPTTKPLWAVRSNHWAKGPKWLYYLPWESPTRIWYLRPDSNRHSHYSRGILSPLCLPISPLRQNYLKRPRNLCVRLLHFTTVSKLVWTKNFTTATSKNSRLFLPSTLPSLIGRDGRIWTYDLSLPKRTHYQTVLHPVPF